MDHVHGSLVRWLVAVVFALCLAWVSGAKADAPQTMYQTTADTTKWFTTKQGSCDWAASLRNTQFQTNVYFGVVDSGGAWCYVETPPAVVQYQYLISSASKCADGSAPNTAMPLAQQCRVAGPDCTLTSTKNLYLGAGAQGTATSLPSTICIQGCVYNTGSVGVQAGTSYSTDIGSGTGGTCGAANYDTIDTTTKPTDPPSLRSCSQKGMVYGTVNGVGICAAAGTIPNSTVQTSGSTVSQATSASGVQAAPQETDTKVVVINSGGGVASVQKTVTNPDGSKTTTTQDQPTYCQQNPTDKVCKGSESNVSGGGDCTAPPVCNGDAVQCAMVNQQWHTRCDSNQPNSLSALGQQLVSGADPVANPASSGQRTVSNISSSIDQTAFLSGGGLADKVVTVHGNAITLPFSRLNQYLVWLGHIFVVMSLIGAIRIVLGGFK